MLRRHASVRVCASVSLQAGSRLSPCGTSMGIASEASGEKMMCVTPEGSCLLGNYLEHLILRSAGVSYSRSYQLSNLPPGHLLTMSIESFCAITSTGWQPIA